MQRQTAHVGDKKPNPLHHAYDIQHTLQTYVSRYHPLANLLPAGHRQEAVVLQPMPAAERLDDSILYGVAILIREHPRVRSHLVQHPCGKLVLDEAATQTEPQSGRAWHLLRHGCVTASSCHLFLGFHESASSELSITISLRKHSVLERAVQQLQQSS